MDTQPLEWPDDQPGENRTDPAVASVNISTETERDLVEVTK